jgi:hypothetical protein
VKNKPVYLTGLLHDRRVFLTLSVADMYGPDDLEVEAFEERNSGEMVMHVAALREFTALAPE